MLDIHRVCNHPLHVLPAQDQGELARLAYRRNRERGPIALQRRMKQKPQPVDDNVAGVPGSVAIPDQMQGNSSGGLSPAE